MANDREDLLQHEQGSGAEIQRGESQEQFNELSELSLEARMAVADKLGIPVSNIGDAVATGTISGDDDVSGTSNDVTEENISGEPGR